MILANGSSVARDVAEPGRQVAQGPGAPRPGRSRSPSSCSRRRRPRPDLQAVGEILLQADAEMVKSS